MKKTITKISSVVAIFCGADQDRAMLTFNIVWIAYIVLIAIGLIMIH